MHRAGPQVVRQRRRSPRRLRVGDDEVRHESLVIEPLAPTRLHQIHQPFELALGGAIR
jgi:hypothetical protein